MLMRRHVRSSSGFGNGASAAYRTTDRRRRARGSSYAYGPRQSHRPIQHSADKPTRGGRRDFVVSGIDDRLAIWQRGGRGIAAAKSTRNRCRRLASDRTGSATTFLSSQRICEGHGLVGRLERYGGLSFHSWGCHIHIRTRKNPDDPRAWTTVGIGMTASTRASGAGVSDLNIGIGVYARGRWPKATIPSISAKKLTCPILFEQLHRERDEKAPRLQPQSHD